MFRGWDPRGEGRRGEGALQRDGEQVPRGAGCAKRWDCHRGCWGTLISPLK